MKKRARRFETVPLVEVLKRVVEVSGNKGKTKSDEAERLKMKPAHKCRGLKRPLSLRNRGL